MKKVSIGLVLGMFLLLSTFGVVFAAKTPGTVVTQLVKVSAGVYTFTITNNGVRGIFHFQVNFAVPASTTGLSLDTNIPNWTGGTQIGGGTAAVVGLSADAHKYYLKSSGDNSITIQFTITPAPASISGQWSAINGGGTFGGTFPAT